MSINQADDLGALTVAQFCDRYGLGHSKVYMEIKAGRLRAVKVGSRTLLLARDIRTWERSLERVQPAA